MKLDEPTAKHKTMQSLIDTQKFMDKTFNYGKIKVVDRISEYKKKTEKLKSILSH